MIATDVQHTLEIFIPGQPFRQKRHRDVSTKGGFRRRYDPSASDKKTIQKALMFYKPAKPLEGLLIVDIDAYFRTPRSWSNKKKKEFEGRYRAKMPDVDNIEKIYFDAMNNMIFSDDRIIVSNQTRKFYSTKPRVEITIKQLSK